MVSLIHIYQSYIECLNTRDWDGLRKYVHDDVCYNGDTIGFDRYSEMLKKNFDDIPDLYFNIHLVFCDSSHVASRIRFDCTPAGTFMGVPVNGTRVTFYENVIYNFKDEKIAQVWSVIDKAAIEASLANENIPAPRLDEFHTS